MQITEIPGLYIVHEFLTVEEEHDILKELDKNWWSGNGIPPNPELKRRTQQYGYEFSYRYRKIMKNFGGKLPHYCDWIIERINKELELECCFDMLLVNEYMSGQGIMAHCDADTIFGPHIASISLISACVMQFININNSHLSFDLYLPPRSLLLMSQQSRFEWKHSISKEFIDIVHNPIVEQSELKGLKVQRDKRVSLTLRSVIQKPGNN